MNKHNYNKDVFYNEDSTSYYLLGAWMTDGCVYKSKDRPNRKTITLTSKDNDWLEKINNLICADKPILKHGTNCYRLMYNSTKLADWLINHGCCQQKSLTLKFPYVPKDFLPDFIRGCWDGDGSLSFTKSANKGKQYQAQANLTSGSLTFCQDLCNVLVGFDVKCSVKKHGMEKRKIEGRELAPSMCWRVVLSGGGSVFRLCKLLYTENSLSMPRKYNLAQNIIAHRSVVKVYDAIPQTMSAMSE